MAQGPQVGRRRRTAQPRRDLGRTFARLLCAIFAVVGLIPLSGGILLRSKPMQAWAASETSRLLRQELGVEATFQVETSLIPLRLAVADLTVPSTDGGGPAVAARLIAVSPRFFSLLAGRIDVGDIELEDSTVRLVLRDGELKNVAHRFPDTPNDDSSPTLKRAPFRSLAVTNARVELDLDGILVKTDSIDIDAFAEENLSFDVALRAAGADFTSQRTIVTDDKTKPAFDEDRLCALDLRVLLSRQEVLVRRLSLLGVVDQDPSADTQPACDPDDENRIALRLSQVRVHPGKEALPRVRGHAMIRLPLGLIDRLSPGSHAEGWVGFTGDLNYDPSRKLPEVSGELSGDHMRIDGYGIAEHLRAEVLITGEVIHVPVLDAGWGNGETHVTGLKIEPFKEHIPLSIDTVIAKDVDFPGTMRDVDVTRHSWADWNFGESEIKKVRGTILPFYLDGGITAHTRDFVMWDRGFDDPARKRMIGIKQATVDGRWRAHSKAVEFYDTNISFGNSHLPVELVRIGLFSTGIVVRLKEGGGKLDLADVSPVADVELKGQSDIYVNLEGPNAHPVLDGTVAVRGLSVAGFPAGNIENARVHFEPLFVEFTELSGNKGGMDYFAPRARLSFDGPASVEFSADVETNNFLSSEFFNVFHFDEDPRFADLRAQGKVKAQVRYLLGGPEDVCPGGHLHVSGSTELGKTEFFGETYSDGDAEFSFEWFDIEAGTAGMRVQVPALTLRKGSGSIFGSVALLQGGVLTGDLIGTQIPVSRIDALGDLMAQTDGFVTGSGTLSGTVDAMAFSATVDVTELKTGKQELPASHLSIRLDPLKDKPPGASTGKKTSCGRPIPADFSPEAYARDDSEGTFHVKGQMLGGQVRLDDVTITRQNNKVLAGTAHLHRLDFGALGSFVGAELLGLPKGTLSGTIHAEKLPLSDPYGSQAELTVTDLSLSQGVLKVELLDRLAKLSISGRKVTSEHLAFRATTSEGQEGILDAEVTIDERKRIHATMDLRPTDLSIFAGTIPGVERAKGPITASFGLSGPVTDPQFSGFFELENGTVHLAGLRSPLSEIFLTVAVDDAGLHVKEGRAMWGGGKVALRGEAPLVDGSLGRTDLTVTARQVALRLDEHVRVAFDADLLLTVPAPMDESSELPSLNGSVNILSAEYGKPMTVTADISTLAKRGEKTVVDTYDAGHENLKVDVLVRSSKPLRVENDLIVATLSIDPAGLRITGTDERLGAVGSVEVDQGGQMFIRSHQFEVQRGLVRFTDPTRMRPEVDVKAVTEYRRYEDRGATQGDTGGTDASGGATNAGNWRILLHAYGSPEDLKVDMNSDPPLAQDDIFLLLTVGLTRTELDQTQNSGVGSSVALEALGKLSGAESAVTDTVPVDEFRFGSSYSSRSGRTEPTVTIGKRLSQRMRASVTTSVSENSEVRSNVEYRATENLSLEGSWDNARNVSSATGGNLGGDVRWRVEFQ